MADYFVHLVYEDYSSDWDGSSHGRKEIYVPVDGPLTTKEVINVAAESNRHNYDNRTWYAAQLVKLTTFYAPGGETMTAYTPVGPRLGAKDLKHIGYGYEPDTPTPPPAKIAAPSKPKRSGPKP